MLFSSQRSQVFAASLHVRIFDASSFAYDLVSVKPVTDRSLYIFAYGTIRYEICVTCDGKLAGTQLSNTLSG